jgi:hypothetical protein
MIYLGTSYNVMPLKVCEKLNSKPKAYDIQIIQLDINRVKVIGELKNVLIRMSTNPKIHQTIDIIVVVIPDNRYWYAMLNGYFATDWLHLWIPFNGKLN